MRDLLILCYHAVSADWPAALSVTPDRFAQQIETLARRGYRGACFTEAISGGWDGRVVVVTFDDGYRSVLELAKPILDAHGYPGTLYVPTDWPERQEPMSWPGIDRWLETRHHDELQSLRWDELRSLAADGWEIGSHTCSHPRLPALDDATLQRELVDSKARVEAELDLACTSLAYPYGDVDARVAAAAGRAGYLAACTIPRVLPDPQPLLWPRTPIFHEDSRLRFRVKASTVARRLRTSSLGRSADRMRVRIVGGD